MAELVLLDDGGNWRLSLRSSWTIQRSIERDPQSTYLDPTVTGFVLSATLDLLICAWMARLKTSSVLSVTQLDSAPLHEYRPNQQIL